MSRHEYDDDEEPYVVIEKQSSGVGAFLIGAAIGASVALLFAPRSGAATRRRITQRVRRAGDAAQSVASDFTGGVVDSFHDARRRVEEQLDTAREAIETKKRQVHTAMEAGRSAADEAREQLQRQLAETKAAYRAGGDVARSGTGKSTKRSEQEKV